MYLRNTKGQLLTRPSGETRISKYLLSGLAKCGVCGGSVVAMTRKNGRHRRKLYGCVHHHKRGTAICSNGLQIEQDRLDQAVLHAIADMLNEDMLQAAVARALTQLRAGQERDVRRKSEIDCELSHVETHISNMVEAIKRARATESLLAGLESEEIRKKVLLDERARLGELEKVQSLETNQVADELSARFRAVKTLLGRHIPQSREMLKKILDGKFVCQPFQANDVRGYRFYASGTYGRLLCGEYVANDGRNPLGTPARLNTAPVLTIRRCDTDCVADLLHKKVSTWRRSSSDTGTFIAALSFRSRSVLPWAGGRSCGRVCRPALVTWLRYKPPDGTEG
jgi:hypothetical protein